jgi:N-methylhydantoinase A
LGKPQFAQIAEGEATPPANSRRGIRKVLFEGAGALESPVYDRARLLQGNVIPGPAIIEEVASTTVVEPGDTVTVNGFGHLIMQLNSAQ